MPTKKKPERPTAAQRAWPVVKAKVGAAVDYMNHGPKPAATPLQKKPMRKAPGRSKR